MLTIVLHICSVCLLLIHARKFPSTGCEGLRPRSISTIYFMTFARTALASTGWRMRSSGHRGPTRTCPDLRQSMWRPEQTENQPVLALYTLEAHIVLYSFSYSIFILVILWNVGESDEQTADSEGAVPGDPHSEARQVTVDWYAVRDHIRKYI